MRSLAAFLVSALLIAQQTPPPPAPASTDDDIEFVCPMDKDVRAKVPGKCPRCGMTLIPVMVRPKPAATPGMNSSTNQLPPKLYTCPMAEHADVVSDKPGVCPKCGMKLVETSTVNHGPMAEDNWRRQHRTSAP